jgi:hypothetical protein
LAAQTELMLRRKLQVMVLVCAVAVGKTATAASSSDAAELSELKKRNATLEELVRQQQSVIENLNRRVSAIEQADAKRSESNEPAEIAQAKSGISFGKVNLSGEGGIGFFHTGSKGMFPNSEFRIDEAKLFVEAPIWGNVYFFTELNLAQRESEDLDLRVGELYLDIENLFGLEENPRLMNLRLGRLDVPFGEEYMTRDAIDNPLISHSIADFWGVDEGVEIYGSLGQFSYILAVQNGGVPVARDFTKDKSVIARVSYDPTRWLHLSLSAMRTGELDAELDSLSEIWFGGGWFRSIGGPGTTRFHANLVEGDVAFRWNSGHLKTFGGVIAYDDNDPMTSNDRTMYFYSIEAKQQITRKLYAAARFGQIFADNGYPLSGNADMGEYFFNYNPAALATELWRLSLGVGYRFNENLLVKTEYSIERGQTRGGDDRDQEDLFAAEAAFKF